MPLVCGNAIWRAGDLWRWGLVLSERTLVAVSTCSCRGGCSGSLSQVVIDPGERELRNHQGRATRELFQRGWQHLDVWKEMRFLGWDRRWCRRWAGMLSCRQTAALPGSRLFLTTCLTPPRQRNRL